MGANASCPPARLRRGRYLPSHTYSPPPLSTTRDIVAKLWKLCDVLRDDGITYHEYVTELTYLLFLKMAEETGTEAAIDARYRWAEIAKATGVAQMDLYREALTFLGSAKNKDAPLVRAIYQNASTSLRQPKNLAKIVQDISELDWYSARDEGLGDLYEGLLEKNAGEKKSGAGQYFTPRPLIDAIIGCVRPRAGETIQDPAAGHGRLPHPRPPARDGGDGTGSSRSARRRRSGR